MEGFYCKECEELVSTEGTDEQLCKVCNAEVEYKEYKSCLHCDEGELTSQLDWTCGNYCELEDNFG